MIDFLTFDTIYTIITTMKNLNTLTATLAPTSAQVFRFNQR